LARDIKKKLDANDFSFGHFTLTLSLQCLVKCRSCSLAICNNEFILDSPCVASEMINRIATNRIGNYCVLKSHACHITSFLLQLMLKMFSSITNASCERWHHSYVQ